MVGASCSLPCAVAHAEDITTVNDEQAVFDDLVAHYRVLAQQQHFDKAIPIAHRALKIGETMFGSDRPQVAQVLNDLGFFHQSLAQYAEAEPLHQRALAIREKTFSSDGPAVVQSLDNLAKVYQGEMRYLEAASLFQRSLEILERHYSPQDPSLAAVLEPYGACLRAGGKAQEAEVIEARVRTLRTQPIPQPGAETAPTR